MSDSTDEKIFPQVPAGFIAIGQDLFQVKAIARVESRGKGIVLHTIGGATCPAPGITPLQAAEAIAETVARAEVVSKAETSE